MTDIPLASPLVQDAPEASAKARALLGAVLPPAVCLLGLVLLWAAGSATGLIPFYFLPTPQAVALEFVNNTEVLVRHGAATLTEALAGFLIGNMTAIVAAAVLSSVPALRDMFYPYALVSRAIPIIVFAPVVVVLLGRGYPPIIAIVSFTVYFPTFLNMMRGLAAVEADLDELLHTFSASRRQRLFLVSFPTAVPYFFAALKISASSCFISALVTEWIGANVGLGYLVVVSSQYFKLASMWAAIFTSAGLTLTLLGLVHVLEHLCGRYTATAPETNT